MLDQQKMIESVRDEVREELVKTSGAKAEAAGFSRAEAAFLRVLKAKMDLLKLLRRRRRPSKKRLGSRKRHTRQTWLASRSIWRLTLSGWRRKMLSWSSVSSRLTLTSENSRRGCNSLHGAQSPNLLRVSAWSKPRSWRRTQMTIFLVWMHMRMSQWIPVRNVFSCSLYSRLA